MELEDQRSVQCLNPQMAVDDQAAREAYLHKRRALIEEVRDMAVRGTIKDHDEQLKKVVKRLVNKNRDE